jgi:hypothetical protein
MREFLDIRIPEEQAARWLKRSDGVCLGGSVRKLVMETDDPRMQVIERAQHASRQQGEEFAASWTWIRRYSERELKSASRLRLKVTAAFEPPGEMCGTKYDETAACDRCGAGATQVGPLTLDLKRIPKGKSFARTIAGEIVVAQHVVNLFKYQSPASSFIQFAAKALKT